MGGARSVRGILVTEMQALGSLRWNLSGPAVARSMSTSATASSSSSSTSTPQETARRSPTARRKLTSSPGADLVGPADPVSNLRPVVYGSVFQTISSSSSQARPSQSRSSLAHPYSISEFTSSSSSPKFSTEPQSQYFVSLLDRLQAAELSHHLRRARSDRFSQDFWTDNNARYTKALEEYKIGLPSPQTSESSSGKGEDILSPFYASWLSANSARHRAYNDRLWQMTKEDLLPALRYQILQSWVRTVARWERLRGRGSAVTR